MNQQTETRFQFSLRDVLVAIATLALATLCVSSSPQFKFDRDDVLLRTFVASVLSVIAALFHRRAWKSDSPWFIPPFVLAGVCAVILRFLRLPWDLETATLSAAYAILFFSAVVWQHAVKRQYPIPWLYGLVSLFVCSILAISELPKFSASRLSVYTRITVDSALLLCRKQANYVRNDRDDDGILEYAQSGTELAETKYNIGVDTTNGSPTSLPPDVVYCYRILKRQGTQAVGGAKSYLDAKGNMTGGYAFVLYPAEYFKTGRLTILINNDGIYTKDLGPTTKEITEAMTEFNPDSSWTKGLQAIR